MQSPEGTVIHQKNISGKIVSESKRGYGFKPKVLLNDFQTHILERLPGGDDLPEVGVFSIGM